MNNSWNPNSLLQALLYFAAFAGLLFVFPTPGLLLDTFSRSSPPIQDLDALKKSLEYGWYWNVTIALLLIFVAVVAKCRVRYWKLCVVIASLLYLFLEGLNWWGFDYSGQRSLLFFPSDSSVLMDIQLRVRDTQIAILGDASVLEKAKTAARRMLLPIAEMLVLAVVLYGFAQEKRETHDTA